MYAKEQLLYRKWKGGDSIKREKKENMRKMCKGGVCSEGKNPKVLEN